MAQHTNAWPSLRVDDWTATRDTLHMWTQIVGKIRLAHSPMVNHWWQVTLYVTPRGLTTSAIPYETEAFDIEFDFIDHKLLINSSRGATRTVALEPKSVAQFYSQTMQALDDLGFNTRIQSHPNEVDPAPRFAEDVEHASYDPNAVHLFWRQLLQANRVIGRFRSRFIGKVSPVHFFWGAMDLACTRFSGRGAPRHPGGAPNVGDWVMVEGYSRELSSCGFFPGGGDEGAFYAYAYPQPLWCAPAIASGETHSKISTIVPSAVRMTIGGRSVTRPWARRGGRWPRTSSNNSRSQPGFGL